MVSISKGVTPNIAVSGLGLRDVLHKAERQSNVKDQKSTREGHDQNM